jgi:DNA-binding response OmpR family regulator
VSQPPLIAVIEDEDHLAQGLVFNLQAEGYRTHHEADGDSALAWLLDPENQPAAILLDVMLPGRDGFSIVRALREAGRYTPVLLLTARGRSEDIVEGFSAGADDYLPKPFDLNVLFARLTALLRRMNWPNAVSAAELPQPSLTLNGRTLDLDGLEIRSSTRTVRLTLMEVWHVHEDTDTRAIDNFIVRLRRYLETDPAKPTHLLTVRGVGYRFMPDAAEPQP